MTFPYISVWNYGLAKTDKGVMSWRKRQMLSMTINHFVNNYSRRGSCTQFTQLMTTHYVRCITYALRIIARSP